MSWRNYRELNIPVRQSRNIREKYSITADILSFQLCRRQYGFFAVRKYQPAHTVQIWYGLLIHQVLDKLHIHYKESLNHQAGGQIPSDEDVESYFAQTETSLIARGIEPVKTDERNAALRALRIFNRVEGPTLYPNVLNTRCELQSEQEDYIMHGIVDVLRDVSVGRNIPNYDSVEIWDYKGTKFPDTSTSAGERKLERYKFQMLVFASLYQQKFGNYPLKGVLYFVNELRRDPEPAFRPSQAIYEIDFRDPNSIRQIEDAMNRFSETVDEIEQCKLQDRWDPPESRPDRRTCDICDLRWDCQAVQYEMRYP
jgi:hypothetical protein